MLLVIAYLNVVFTFPGQLISRHCELDQDWARVITQSSSIQDCKTSIYSLENLVFRVDHGWASQEPGDDYVCAEEHDGLLQGKLRTILTFLHSFSYDKVGKREKVGTLMGKDPFGNSYYELPAQPQVENQSNMRSLRQTKIKTLRSWERGCPLGGMTLLKPTEKRFSLVVHDFKADYEQ